MIQWCNITYLNSSWLVDNHLNFIFLHTWDWDFFSCNLYHILTFWKPYLHSAPLRRLYHCWEEKSGAGGSHMVGLKTGLAGPKLWSICLDLSNKPVPFGALWVSYLCIAGGKTRIIKCCETWILHNPSVVKFVCLFVCLQTSGLTTVCS